MRIEFDPTNPDEAAAVRAMLTAMHQPVDYSGLEAPLGDYLRHVGETPRALMEDLKASFEPSVTREAIPTEASDRVESLTRMGSQGPETDSQGEPHDPRIHSTPATTNKDGTWRAKRGVTADQIAAVRAEREANALAEDGHIEEIPTAENPDDPKHVQSDPIVTAPPAPPVTTAPPAPIATGSPSFLDVMKAITAAQKDGKIDTAKVKELCAAVGAGESTMGLNGPDNGDKRGAFMALLASETEGK